jgi:alkylation response protein AidB-like acyl-CoA dehydrogenase
MSHDWIKVELDRFLDAEFSPDLSLIEWRKRLVSAGWAAPSWPEDSFGRGFSQAEALVVSRVFADRRIVGAAQVGPRRLAAETILAHGSNEQKQRYLPKILTGEHAWCQLFSEPGSGSDLAGASTRADRKGRSLAHQRSKSLEYQRPSCRFWYLGCALELGPPEASGSVLFFD